MRISTGLLISLGAIFLGWSTGGFLTLSLLPTRHPFWVIVVLVLGAMGYWFMARAYFILENRLERAYMAYSEDDKEGQLLSILMEDS
jgi:hypothetical protein